MPLKNLIEKEVRHKSLEFAFHFEVMYNDL